MAPENCHDGFRLRALRQQILKGAATEMPDQTGQTAPKLDTSTKLAYDRTRLAYERTMMAWVRTATSMITFGFTVYKFFQIEREGAEQKGHLVGARGFALILVSIGLVSLLVATLEHRHNMRVLRAQDPGMPRSLSALVAALVSVLGILALILMVFRQ